MYYYMDCYQNKFSVAAYFMFIFVFVAVDEEGRAEEIGCRPTFWRLLTQRPTAFWHALFAFGGMNQLCNRLVGPGRLEDTERWIEERFRTRHYGTYLDAGGKYDYNRLKGEVKNGDGLGPTNRRVPPDQWVSKAVDGWQATLEALKRWEQEQGVVVGPFDGQQQIKAHLEQNLRYAKEDTEKRGIRHSLQVGEEVQDGYINAGGARNLVFGNRATAGGKGLAVGQEEAVPASRGGR